MAALLSVRIPLIKRAFVRWHQRRSGPSRSVAGGAQPVA